MDKYNTLIPVSKKFVAIVITAVAVVVEILGLQRSRFVASTIVIQFVPLDERHVKWRTLYSYAAVAAAGAAAVDHIQIVVGIVHIFPRYHRSSSYHWMVMENEEGVAVVAVAVEAYGHCIHPSCYCSIHFWMDSTVHFRERRIIMKMM